MYWGLGLLESHVAPAFPLRRDRRAAARCCGRAVDFLVTGDPLFSQHYTARLGRGSRPPAPLSELPAAIPGFFQDLVKLPVFAAAGLGALLGIVISPRRMLMPIVLLLAGIVTFIAIGVAGASVIERYLAVPALALMVLAAVAVAGWTMLLPSWVRTVWMVAAGADRRRRRGLPGDPSEPLALRQRLRFRGQAHRSHEVLNDPQVQAGLRCGPLTGPNHKIVPDSRWIADLGDGEVWPARRATATTSTTVPLPDQGRGDRRHLPLRDLQARLDRRRRRRPHPSPAAGLQRVKTSRFYAAYVRC